MPNIPSYQAPSNPAQAMQEEQERAAAIPGAKYEDSPQNIRKQGMVESMGRFMHSKPGKIIGDVFSLGQSRVNPLWKMSEKALLKDKYDSVVHGTPYGTEGGPMEGPAQTMPNMNALTMKYKSQMGY